jgi:phosphoribosylamine--glycine ligase
MRILVVGGGGREHTIVWKLRQSPKAKEIYCAPGNGGIADMAICVPIQATDISGIVEYAKRERFDLVIVAPDDPLYLGLVDALQKEGLRAFGPTADGARLEGSKVYAKTLMKKHGIPTAEYEVFSDYAAACAYVETCAFPTVVKADGLALGKGVVICETIEQAKDALDNIMVKKIFGVAGNRVVIEEFMEGPEVSVLAFCDGKTILPMASAQDHKRAFDNDEGPNTGGMGTFSPSPKYTDAVQRAVEDTIINRTIQALQDEGVVFKGVLYFGIMLTEKGPKLLEYNARFGDPEAQVVLPRMQNDLIDVMNAVIDGKLDEITLQWDKRSAVCVVIASGGYPGAYNKGLAISGLKDAIEADIFHAGTVKKGDDYITAGGRVLGVTALGKDIIEAREKAYKEVKKIRFEGMQYRTDIGIK